MSNGFISRGIEKVHGQRMEGRRDRRNHARTGTAAVHQARQRAYRTDRNPIDVLPLWPEGGMI